ncbi:copper amine oxidase N-terminal domain-containing protein [Paenibacillus silvisoli]|uniref:copper amine oxidase N-terminal domain-containing protein n=1 Tax=Paenibacillus silvisoli TaxID=3110539 RepID=UPI0028057F66|nr:copper amine oxidase N-terminal domain-containing protein [Paenibacillus silvisoli]
MNKHFGKKAGAMLLFASLLLSSAAPLAAAPSTETQQPQGNSAEFTQLAASCSSDTIKQVYIAGGDMLYDTLYGARKEDRPRVEKVCGIIKSIAAAGKPAKWFDPTPESFFHGLEISFAQGSSASVFQYGDALYLQDETQFLKLSDTKAIEAYQSFLVRTEFLSISPEKPRFGETMRVKGHQPLFWSGSVFVFWIPESKTYTSSPSKSGGTPPYPVDSALLLYEGKQQYGYYDVTFKLPALGKAADGSMVPLGSRGSLAVLSGAGQGGNHSEGLMSLLPANEPFLTVNGAASDSTDLKPLLREGRALLPLRSAAKLAGQSVIWDAGSWSVLIRSKPPQKTNATYLHPQLWIDNKLAAPELQPILLGGITYVPIRALTAAFGISVAWDSASHSVQIGFLANK